MFVALIDLQALQGKDPERGIPRWIAQFVKNLKHSGVRIVGLENTALPSVHVDVADDCDQIGPNSRGFVRSAVAGERAVYICPSPFEPIRPVRYLLPSHIVEAQLPVATVMFDLVLYLFPDLYQIRRGDHQTYEARKRLFESSDAFLCISHSTARDLARVWDVDKQRIHFVGTGIDDSFEPTRLSPEFRAKLGIVRRYVFCVGRDDPRKQTTKLIEAYALLSESERQGLQLVITCRIDDSTRKEWEDFVTRSGLNSKDVIFTGLVTDTELRGLYSECALFVEPSLYEGFGFPVAEAASCGAVVMSSNTSSLPEILGFSESTFDPKSTEAIAAAIRTGINNQGFRSRNLRAGRTVKETHSWTKVARRALEVLDLLAREVEVPPLTTDEFCGTTDSAASPPPEAIDRTFPLTEFDDFEIGRSRSRLRVGVYDRFWATMGGGEQHAGAAAVVLSKEFDVELIGVEDFDKTRFARVLGQPEAADLPLRIIDSGPTAATEVSADYDVFVNHSFTSEDLCLAKRGLYVTFFPQEYRSGNYAGHDVPVLRTGDGASAEPDVRDSLQLAPSALFSFECSIAQNVTCVLECKEEGWLEEVGLIDAKPRVVVPGRSFIQIRLGTGTTTFRFKSESSARLLSPRSADGRRIVVPDSSDSGQPAFTTTYNRILGNSAYTSKWIGNRWHVDAPVHYPPVALRKLGAHKDNVILSIGRFFGEESGHCKQQLHLVRAFRRLLDGGLTGWRLVLVGGADRAYRDYALAVRREAAGLPVDVLLNADFGTLNEELSRASIYWHATGLGMDLADHPERAEHFGIAPVEAMSAGSIPVLFNGGGLAEIVREGHDGFLFSSIDELVSITRSIIAMSEVQRESLREAAVSRSRKFSSERFARELLAHIHDIMSDQNVS